MSAKSKHEAQKQEALEWLREHLSPGDIVYSIVRHVSQSGMQRCIDFYAFRPRDTEPANFEEAARNPEPLYLSSYVGKLLGYHISEKHGGVIVGGAGMDMCFHLVYSTGRKLFPEGYDGRDGGYALRHWSL